MLGFAGHHSQGMCKKYKGICYQNYKQIEKIDPVHGCGKVPGKQKKNYIDGGKEGKGKIAQGMPSAKPDKKVV